MPRASVPGPLEIPARVLTQVARPLLQRIPLAWPVARGLMDAMYRVALLPLARNRRRGVAREDAGLVARTDELNRRAEQYYVDSQAREYILGKPFTDEVALPRHLITVGVLLHGLRMTRRDVVVELGAGGCWVSHVLNRYGCKTIAVDVSPTALEIGRELFGRDPATNWGVEPEFLPYDGHRLPLASGSCTKAIMVDAFHHVPNQREILTELSRILVDDGIVGMFEPGAGHGTAESSLRDVADHGVLENELVVEDVAALALSCGFQAAHVLVASPGGPWEVPVSDLGAFTGGQGFRPFWQHLSESLLSSHYLLLYKGDPAPTTRQSKRLGARIELRPHRTVLRTRAGRPAPIDLALTNTAETRWLAQRGPGWTRLGAHLSRGDGAPVDFDWLRLSLPHDVVMHEQVVIHAELPAVPAAGNYLVTFDLVIEGVTWFGERGSRTLTCTLAVD